MKLVDSANLLFKVLDAFDSSNEDLVSIMSQFESSLVDCGNPEEREKIIRMNEYSLLLPPDLGIVVYRRLLELKRTPKLLRDFAFYLLMYGPFWDDEAEELLKEADVMEGKSNGEAPL